MRNRRQNACSPHLNRDVFNSGCGLMRLEFECDCPARTFRCLAELFAQIKIADFDDYPVDFKSDAVPSLLGILTKLNDLFDGMADFIFFLNRKSPAFTLI